MYVLPLTKLSIASREARDVTLSAISVTSVIAVCSVCIIEGSTQFGLRCVAGVVSSRHSHLIRRHSEDDTIYIQTRSA